MADLRADLAERLNGVAPIYFTFIDEYAALVNAVPSYLAALARIAEIVANHDSRVDYAGDALDEIRAVLAGAAEGGG